MMMYSGREAIHFSSIQKRVLGIVYRLFDWLGIWRYPGQVDIERLSMKLKLYWLYTAGKPIVRAERGSGLESYFEKTRQVTKPPLPAEFVIENRIELTAVGDLMCNSVLEKSAGTYYQEVAGLIFDADISFGNLESSLTSDDVRQEKSGPNGSPKVNATMEQYQAVRGYRDRRYSILQLANNHILDCGREGLTTTRQCLDNDGILQTGTMLTEEDGMGTILNAGGIRLGFISATYGVNGRPFPEDQPHLVNLVRFHTMKGTTDLSLLETQAAWCRQQGCDLVIAGLHWGYEWEFYPRASQVRQAHQLAEAGVDMIIGHHAHVIQPFEWYRTRRDPDRWVPILYGLGNLVPPFSAPFNTLSLIARLSVAKGYVSGVQKTIIENLSLTPAIQLHKYERGEDRVWLESLESAGARYSTGEFAVYLSEAEKYANLALGSGWQMRARSSRNIQ